MGQTVKPGDRLGAGAIAERDSGEAYVGGIDPLTHCPSCEQN
jgi:hypothetical protein